MRHHQQQHYGVGVGVGTLPAHQYLMAANVGGVAAGRMDSFYIESLYKQVGIVCIIAIHFEITNEYVFENVFLNETFEIGHSHVCFFLTLHISHDTK